MLFSDKYRMLLFGMIFQITTLFKANFSRVFFWREGVVLLSFALSFISTFIMNVAVVPQKQNMFVDIKAVTITVSR